MAQRAHDLALGFVNSVRHDPRKQYSAIAVAALASLMLGRIAWKDYRLFLSYGPGGLPSNVFGWTATNILRLMGIDMTDVSKAEEDADQRSWLGEEWEPTKAQKSRDGSRPSVGPHPIPQRQLDQHGPKEVQQKFLSDFVSLVKQNPDLVQFKLSQYERHTDAMWVADSCPVYALGSGHTREVSHVHTNTDYSAHVVLSPKDAAKVIRAGWGQLHALSGVSFLGKKVVPANYVLLYSARSDDEVDTLIEIIKAGIGFMTDASVVRS
ncbi:uncharacterized protein PV06_06415 [Exophiala oligosperma]|uniref:Luciferase domain-containing protein n=1 Tax=Exophiala oligosperma TaxID=215243 RepID=A0A0D2DIU6_9EURO|nr:uncharacterized protein PV06_06415 [Exophiala oligosperma]KIW42913.1 hypothetical protein PV06_06415 [Exophiala oligosperma]